MPRLHRLSPTPPQVWAVEDTRVQITWGRLPPGPVTATWPGGRATVEHGGGPGALDVTGLAPDTEVELVLAWPGGSIPLTTRTLAPPPGELLCRLATVSDLHLGSWHWGALKLTRDRSGHPVPFPLRCARAALAEAVAWGAGHVVVKGDAAHHQEKADFDQLGQLLDGLPSHVGVLLIPGNHDLNGHTPYPLPAAVGARGVPYVTTADHLDLPGIRVVVGSTVIPGKGHGTLADNADAMADLVAGAGGRPWFLGLHHQLQPHRIPTHYPAGVAAPASTAFLDRLASINPAGLVTSGHTHRNRARRHGPLVVTEVGSTRDWPGVWAGYAVHEGGIRQVVRRVAAPDALAWLEPSHRALLGHWETWAQGPLRQRCLSRSWALGPPRTRPPVAPGQPEASYR